MQFMIRAIHGIALFTVCEQTRKWENFCPNEKN